MTMTVNTFEANSKEYEVQLSCDGDEVTIRTVTGGKPANGYSYHVKMDTAYGLEVLAGQNAIKELVAIAKSDVLEKRYEGFLNALKTLHK